MHAALAEMALEDLTKDAEDDVFAIVVGSCSFLHGFVVDWIFSPLDEEDIFESNFESTD